MDDQTKEAINAVAARVAARILATAEVADEWRNHPDISKHDWQQVVERVDWLVGYADVPDQRYEAAYRHLAKRAQPQSTVVAWVTVDDRGRLTPESTVTVDDDTWSVPNKVEHGGVMWWPRVGYALREFGWRPVRGAEPDESRLGVIGVPVERIDETDSPDRA